MEGSRRTGRNAPLATNVATNGVAKGHSERPLAEVFSQMPPLRATSSATGGACRMPFLTSCQHAYIERRGG
jgi:hypothetical protein